jgi:TolA-binding protein
MKEIEPLSLRPEELIMLVQQLRQQLSEREQEIEHLKRQLAGKQGQSGADKASQETLPGAPEQVSPGSQEDLMAQLEKIYPEGR